VRSCVQEELLNAAMLGRMGQVQQSLAAGVDVNCKGKVGVVRVMCSQYGVHACPDM
jgi:hypothetical protein